MDSFQKGVLFSAIAVLLISLIFIGLMLSYAKDESWPPVAQGCPDYWTMNKEGKCVNEKNLGTCAKGADGSGGMMDFKDYDNCKKYTWANGCNVTWDGITYGYGTNKPCS